MSSTFRATPESGEVVFRLFTFCASSGRSANPLGKPTRATRHEKRNQAREGEVKVVGAARRTWHTASRPTERGAWGRRRRRPWVATVTLRPARPPTSLEHTPEQLP